MKRYDQNELNERNLLRYTPDKIYTKADLETQNILNRAIRLLFQARFGQETSFWRISPHIKYDHLPQSVTANLETRYRLDKIALSKLRATVRLAVHPVDYKYVLTVAGNNMELSFGLRL